MERYLTRKHARKLRDELKKLPFVCRRSYIKMNDLKLQTKKLHTMAYELACVE